MVPTQAICSSFKQELLSATHNFNASGGHAFKIALLTASSTSGAATDHYSGGTVNINSEVTGAGYTAGGAALTNVNPSLSSTTALTDFSNDPTWSSSTITARGALIYNSTQATRSVMVLDFGSDKVSSAGDFVINFPAADASNAIIRIT